MWQAVLTAAVESGVSHILSTPATQALVQQWQELATFETLSLQPDGTITDASSQQVVCGGAPCLIGCHCHKVMEDPPANTHHALRNTQKAAATLLLVLMLLSVSTGGAAAGGVQQAGPAGSRGSRKTARVLCHGCHRLEGALLRHQCVELCQPPESPAVTLMCGPTSPAHCAHNSPPKQRLTTVYLPLQQLLNSVHHAHSQVIPAENLVAAFQPGPGRLMGVASSAADARVMLEALEAGTAGVLLRTDDPLQVCFWW